MITSKDIDIAIEKLHKSLSKKRTSHWYIKHIPSVENISNACKYNKDHKRLKILKNHIMLWQKQSQKKKR